MRKYFS